MIAIGTAATVGLLAQRAGWRQAEALAVEHRLGVLSYIPAGMRPAIASGDLDVDLAPFFDTAARDAVREGQALYVPAGVYPMRTWSPPSGLLVTTDGRSTIFEQLPTNGVPQRFIRVLSNNVQLWPGGSATIRGNIEANATSFNSGIYVYADDGASIDQFTVGDVYGTDIGGDVLETGSHKLGNLGTCTIGKIYGDNIYRNIVSITAGRRGTIAGVYQTGGVGLFGLDFEPDPSSGSSIEEWHFGVARCHRVSVVGDPSVPIGAVTGDVLDLDYNQRASRPPFNYAGVNAARSPHLFEVGLRYRNLATLRIGSATINNFPRGAIIDIGETESDGFTKLVRIDALELNNNGVRSTYEIAQQKTERLSVGHLRSVHKPNGRVATIVGGSTVRSIADFERSEIEGRRVLEHSGQVRFGS